MYVFDTSKLIEIFYDCDEFCKVYTPWKQHQTLPLNVKHYSTQSALSQSEIMSILIFFHLSGIRCFKWYYQNFVCNYLKGYFPDLVSYNRFVELIPSVWHYLYAYGNAWRQGELTNCYFIDSSKLPVCHNKRIHNHKVFKDIAQRGKTSIGWFFGLKIHLIINQIGQVVAFQITAGNISDKNQNLLLQLAKGLQGKMFGDRGYVSNPVLEALMEQGLQLIYKLKKNMKNKLIEWQDKLMSKKRGVVETVIDLLKNACNIDHTRHRSPLNAITHIMAGISAYSFLDDKPTISLKNLNILT